MKWVSGFKQRVKKHPSGQWIAERYKRWRYRRLGRKYSDREFIIKLYKKANHGRYPALESPVTFTEKLQWLKLFYRDPLMVRCTDKLQVKQYLSELGLENYVIPTIAMYDSVGDIAVDMLPDRFVLKISCGSDMNVFCRGDKTKIRWKWLHKITDIWLHEDFSLFGREWNYQGQAPKILIEPLLADDGVIDYKFMCFNGMPRVIQVNHEEHGCRYVDFYDLNWTRLEDLTIGVAPNSASALPPPAELEEMTSLARRLAQPFPFVRVDLYSIGGRIYVGELTFFPGSGFWTMTPTAYDKRFGEWLTLPDQNIESL